MTILSETAVRSIDELRILTFGAFIAGNTTGLALAELGADVVKIEAVARPEVLRNLAYGFGDRSVVEPSGVPNTVMYADLSRSTRNLSLEMNTGAGRSLFKRLVAVADVVIENFGAETMRHWGCSFDDLTAVNPRLVMVSLSGYGRTGPRGTYLAYATNISNFSGLTTTWNFQHGTHSDYIAAIHAATAVLAAVAQVDRTGTGVAIDIAQTEALGAVLAPIYLDPLNNGRDTRAAGNAVPGSLFTDVFACQGHDRWLAIELEDLSDWSTLCDVLGRPDLLVHDHDEIDARRRGLHDAIAAWSSVQSPHTAAQLLQNAGLAAGAVYDNEDIVRDPQLPGTRRGRRDRPTRSRRGRVLPVAVPHVEDAGLRSTTRASPRPTHDGGPARVARPRRSRDRCARSRGRGVPSSRGGIVRHALGIVSVAFGNLGVEDAARRAADLGFEHLDTGVGAIDRLDPAALAGLPIPIGDRISGFEVRSGCTGMAPLERRGEDRFDETVQLFRSNPGARWSPGPAAPRAASRRRKRSSRPFPVSGSPSTPATSRRGARTRFASCISPATCSYGKRPRDGRSCTPTKAATSTSRPSSPSSNGSTTRGS